MLDNENVDVDGLQLIGVPYKHATHTEHFRSVLANMSIDRRRASILMTHAPDRPLLAGNGHIAASLRAHPPWTVFSVHLDNHADYRQFVYGLSRIGGLQVYTSCGAGTWVRHCASAPNQKS